MVFVIDKIKQINGQTFFLMDAKDVEFDPANANEFFAGKSVKQAIEAVKLAIPTDYVAQATYNAYVSATATTLGGLRTDVDSKLATNTAASTYQTIARALTGVTYDDEANELVFSVDDESVDDIVIPLPTDRVVTGGSYDTTTQKITLTIQSGDNIEIPLSDLINALPVYGADSTTISETLSNGTHVFGLSNTYKGYVDDAVSKTNSEKIHRTNGSESTYLSQGIRLKTGANASKEITISFNKSHFEQGGSDVDYAISLEATLKGLIDTAVQPAALEDYVLKSSISLTSTAGSESITYSGTTVDLMTRTTAQTISAVKTFSATPIVKEIQFKNNVSNPTGNTLSIHNDNGYNSKITMSGKGIMLTGGSVLPTTPKSWSNPESLGSSSYPWNNLYLRASIDFGDNATINKDASNRINFNYNGNAKVKVGSSETTFVNRIGADSDNTIDIGRDSVAFKDTYIKGKHYLGYDSEEYELTERNWSVYHNIYNELVFARTYNSTTQDKIKFNGGTIYSEDSIPSLGTLNKPWSSLYLSGKLNPNGSGKGLKLPSTTSFTDDQTLITDSDLAAELSSYYTSSSVDTLLSQKLTCVGANADGDYIINVSSSSASLQSLPASVLVITKAESTFTDAEKTKFTAGAISVRGNITDASGNVWKNPLISMDSGNANKGFIIGINNNGQLAIAKVTGFSAGNLLTVAEYGLISMLPPSTAGLDLVNNVYELNIRNSAVVWREKLFTSVDNDQFDITSGGALTIDTSAEGTIASKEWVNSHNYLTQHQSLANYLLTSTFETFTGTTAPATYVAITGFKTNYLDANNVAYQGDIPTELPNPSKLTITDRKTTSTTESIEYKGNSAVSLDLSKYALKTELHSPYTLPHATNGALGGIKLGYTLPSGESNKYPVELDTNDKAFVSVPWTDTTYTNGTGLDLTGTTFSLKTATSSVIGGVTVDDANGVVRSINGKDIFASKATSDASGNTITTTYQTIAKAVNKATVAGRYLKLWSEGQNTSTDTPLANLELPVVEIVDVESSSYDPTTHILTINFAGEHGGSSTDVDLSGLVDTYTSDGTTIALSNNQFALSTTYKNLIDSALQASDLQPYLQSTTAASTYQQILSQGTGITISSNTVSLNKAIAKVTGANPVSGTIGGVIPSTNLTYDSSTGELSLTKANVTSALGYTPDTPTSISQTYLSKTDAATLYAPANASYLYTGDLPTHRSLGIYFHSKVQNSQALDYVDFNPVGNADVIKHLYIIPTKTSDLTNDGSDGTGSFALLSDLNDYVQNDGGSATNLELLGSPIVDAHLTVYGNTDDAENDRFKPEQLVEDVDIDTEYYNTGITVHYTQYDEDEDDDIEHIHKLHFPMKSGTLATRDDCGIEILDLRNAE